MNSQNVGWSPIKFRYFFRCDVLALNIMHAYQIEQCVWPKSPGKMLALASVMIGNIPTNCYPHGCAVRRNAEDCQPRHFRPNELTLFHLNVFQQNQIATEKPRDPTFRRILAEPSLSGQLAI